MVHLLSTHYKVINLIEGSLKSLEEAEKHLSIENEARGELQLAQERFVEAKAFLLSSPIDNYLEPKKIINFLHWIIAITNDLNLGLKEAQARRSLKITSYLNYLPSLRIIETESQNNLITIQNQRSEILKNEPRLSLKRAA